MLTDFNQLAEDISKHKNVLVYVGPAINNLSTKDPIYVQGRPSSRRFAHRASSSCHVTPGKAHLALCQLLKAGIVDTFLTQNTDGMLLKAGAEETSVIEINGNVHTEECLGCGLSFVREFCVQTSHCGIRECQLCGGRLRDTMVRAQNEHDMVIIQNATQAIAEADFLLVLGNMPTCPTAQQLLVPYLSSTRSVVCVSNDCPGEGLSWLKTDPAEFCPTICDKLGVEVSKYTVHRIISLMITKEDDQWLIRTHAVTGSGRNFSCLKGVDVIPCQGEDELDDDPEVLCYDPFRCSLPSGPVIDKCDLEIYYIFFGFNQEPEWSVRVPLKENSHLFHIICSPGDESWVVYHNPDQQSANMSNTSTPYHSNTLPQLP